MDNLTEQTNLVRSKWQALFETTKLSKWLAAVLFISLPFIGFWLGYIYHNANTKISSPPTPEFLGSTKQLPDAGIEVPPKTLVSVNTLSKEVFGPGVEQIPGNGDLMNFDIISVQSNKKISTISHDSGEPLLLQRDFKISPNERFVYVTAQKFIDEPEIELYIYEIATERLNKVEIAKLVGDDDLLYPDEISIISWDTDDKLRIKPRNGLDLISVSSDTPWLVAQGTAGNTRTDSDTCVLVVDNQSYQITPCNKKDNGEYGSDFGQGSSKYFVTGVNTTDSVGGWWNGPTAASQAHQALPGGKLEKVGYCYQNDRVKLCEAK